MNHFLRPIFAASFAALLVALPSAPSDAARRSSAFDGQWSVVIYTTYGDCDRSLRYSLQIIGGQVVSAQQNYQLAGAVAPNGSIRVTVAEAGRSANGSGRLVGNNGSGQWRTSTGQCAGQWTAARRG
jgi:hypothetical protein